MSAKFSEKLTSDLIAYFSKRWNLAITSDEAESFLLSLADLYLAMSKIEQERAIDCGLGGSAARQGGETHPSYPCSMHT